jgi:hypothetical protein
MYFFKRLRAAIRFKEAVRRADKAHRETGRRYYVMPNGIGGKLIIMDRQNFRKLKHKHYLPYNVFIKDLMISCFYCTPSLNGRGALTKDVIDLKRRRYFRFLSEHEKPKKGISYWFKFIKNMLNGKQV